MLSWLAMPILGHSISDTPHSSLTASACEGLGKDFLTLEAVPRHHIVRLLGIARDLKSAGRQGRVSHWLSGLTLGLIFEKPSTRTRVSFEAGMNQLGGQAVFLASDKIQLSRGESLADTALVLSRYLDGLVVRTFEQSTLEAWAHHATIPVINGLTPSSLTASACEGLGKDFLTLEAVPRHHIVRLLGIARDLKSAGRQGRVSHWLSGLTLGLILKNPRPGPECRLKPGFGEA